MPRALALVVIGLLAGLPFGAPASADGPLQASITVNGERLPGEPVQLRPGEPARVDLRLTNRGDDAITVRGVRLTGSAIGMPLFEVDATVAIEVPGRATVTQAVSVDLSSIRMAATGLVALDAALLGDPGSVLLDEATTGQVDGSPLSVWGTFCLSVLALAVASGVVVGRALRGHRLPQARRRRALLLGALGVLAGLAIVAVLSLAGLAAPHWWLALLSVCGLGGAAAWGERVLPAGRPADVAEFTAPR